MDENKINSALAQFRSDLNCCQAILTTYGTKFGVDHELALRIGTGFGGGIARHGEICGAVNGGIMVIGLKFGMVDDADKQARENTYNIVTEFLARFKAKHGSIACLDILGYDIHTHNGLEAAKEKNLFKTLCPDFVQTVAQILEDIL
jgi:C_GCAxxG_C_C family probable redox protein